MRLIVHKPLATVGVQDGRHKGGLRTPPDFLVSDVILKDGVMTEKADGPKATLRVSVIQVFHHEGWQRIGLVN